MNKPTKQDIAFSKFVMIANYVDFLALSIRGVNLPYKAKDRLNQIIKHIGFFQKDIEKITNEVQQDDIYNDADIIDMFINASVSAEFQGKRLQFQNDLFGLVAKYKI